jgi:transcription elongation factor Elf1
MVKYYCELCEKEVVVIIHGLIKELDQEETIRVTEWARHYHWCDFHRNCAICGEYIKSGELDLIVNNKYVHIYDKYTDEYEKVRIGEHRFLDVHKKCVE